MRKFLQVTSSHVASSQMTSSQKTWALAVCLGALFTSSVAQAQIDLGTVPAGVKPEYIQQLYKDAIAKGQTKVVIVAGDRRFAPLDEFTKRFPGIEVVNPAVVGNERAPLVMSQHRAGRMEFDLVEGSGGVLAPLHRANALAKVDYGALGFSPDDQLAGLAVYADSVMAHGYNSKTVKKDVLPKSFEDFKDPRWKNQVVGDLFAFSAGWAFQATVRGEAPVIEEATDIFSTANVVLSGAAIDLVNSGEKSLFMFANITRILQAQKGGSPVEMHFHDGLGIARFGLGLTSLAPNPEAAKLFMYWIHTPEGQAQLFKHSSAAVAKNVESPVAKLVRETGVKFIFESEQNWQERGRLTGVIQNAVVRKR